MDRALTKENGQDTLSKILGRHLGLLWRYNGPMQIVNFPPEFKAVGATGPCPHCATKSYFKNVGSPHLEENATCICTAAQCEACKHFVLIVGGRRHGGVPYALEAVYPLGRPNDQVDFAEALRCQWIKAYKATVVMCRRGIQASALEKGALPKNRLVDQIDELAEKGVITQSLKEMAHEVRLTGNVGAHPDEDGLEAVSEKDADDIVEFTREYFHHVYVMPAKLEARRKKEPPGGAKG